MPKFVYPCYYFEWCSGGGRDVNYVKWRGVYFGVERGFKQSGGAFVLEWRGALSKLSEVEGPGA